MRSTCGTDVRLWEQLIFFSVSPTPRSFNLVVTPRFAIPRRPAILRATFNADPTKVPELSADNMFCRPKFGKIKMLTFLSLFLTLSLKPEDIRSATRYRGSQFTKQSDGKTWTFIVNSFSNLHLKPEEGWQQQRNILQ